MEAKEELAKIAIKIDNLVLNMLNTEASVSNHISPIISEAIENSHIVCFGGKRLRGAFTYFSYLMHGGKDFEEILKAGSVIEILHSYLLAHDDVMDMSDMRHRKPTLNKIYENKSKKLIRNTKDAKHFGESIAINIGDVLSHIALNNFLNINFDPALKIKALSKIHREFADTGYGQMIDCFGEILSDVGEDHIMLVHYYKTGKYTYETPLHVGAILAGATEDALKTLTDYAIPGGIAFQIQDDILGMFGDEYRIGKPADSDLKEGKKTLLIVKACEWANAKQSKILNRTLGNKRLTLDDLEAVREIIIETGSLEYSKNTALNLVTKAKNSLEELNNKELVKEGRDFLDGIADYMINRDL